MNSDNFNLNKKRSTRRKRKSIDFMLNITIGIVVVLILLIGGQLIFGGDSSKPVVTDEKDDPIVSEDLVKEEEEPIVLKEDIEKEDEEEVVDLPIEEDKEEPVIENNETIKEPVQNGQWKPIGTVQKEPFTAVFETDHINWQEMTKAFQYATNMGEEMIVWWVTNGGNHQSAVGTVSNLANKHTPFEVRIEWVANEGWMPVSVKQLDSNPRLLENRETEENN